MAVMDEIALEAGLGCLGQRVEVSMELKPYQSRSQTSFNRQGPGPENPDLIHLTPLIVNF